MSPVEPPPSEWLLPDPRAAEPGEEVLGLGADLEPGTLLAAYRSGLFPMNLERRGPLGWWSPDPRGVLPLDGMTVSRSLRRSCRRLTVTVDTAFEEVVRRCGDPRRPGGWITEEFVAAYVRLHRLGWAHSVETRTPDGSLVGGLYGVEIGGLFAGESMFSSATDASKVALVALVDVLAAAPGPGRLLDVQWRTDHLASLGVVEVPRPVYLDLLAAALRLPPAFPASLP
jgi:leucyl/phenylalanyl-tRNA--protein transferase